MAKGLVDKLKEVPERILSKDKKSKSKNKSKAEKMAAKKKKQRKKRVKDAKVSHSDDLRFKVQRSRPDGGFVGTFTGSELDDYEYIESLIQDRYGGGKYTVKVFEGKDLDEELSFSIAGEPKPRDDNEDNNEDVLEKLDEKGKTNTAEIITAISPLISPVMKVIAEGMQREKFDWAGLAKTAAPYIEKLTDNNRKPTQIEDIATVVEMFSRQQGNQMDLLQIMQQYHQMQQEMRKDVKEEQQVEKSGDMMENIVGLISNLTGKKGAKQAMHQAVSGEAAPSTETSTPSGTLGPTSEQFAGQEPTDEEINQIASAIAGVVQTAEDPEQAAKGITSSIPFLQDDMIPNIQAFVSQLKPEWSEQIGDYLREEQSVDLDDLDVGAEKAESADTGGGGATQQRESSRFSSSTQHPTPTNQHDDQHPTPDQTE